MNTHDRIKPRTMRVYNAPNEWRHESVAIGDVVWMAKVPYEVMERTSCQDCAIYSPLCRLRRFKTDKHPQCNKQYRRDATDVMFRDVSHIYSKTAEVIRIPPKQDKYVEDQLSFCW